MALAIAQVYFKAIYGSLVIGGPPLNQVVRMHSIEKLDLTVGRLFGALAIICNRDIRSGALEIKYSISEPYK